MSIKPTNAHIVLPIGVSDTSIHDLLMDVARTHLELPQLDRGNISIDEATYSCVFDAKSHCLTVTKSYIEQVPGRIWGYYEVERTDVMFKLECIKALKDFVMMPTSEAGGDCKLCMGYATISKQLADAEKCVDEIQKQLDAAQSKSAPDQCLTEARLEISSLTEVELSLVQRHREFQAQQQEKAIQAAQSALIAEVASDSLLTKSQLRHQ